MKAFPSCEPKIIIDSWKEALGIMATIANNRDECQWVAPLYPIDKEFTRNPLDTLGDISRNFDLTVNKIAKDKK